MGRPVDQWSDWFLCILLRKLDNSHLLWKSSRSSSKMIPTYDELKDFLLIRAHVLETADPQAVPSLALSLPFREEGIKGGG